ncbi:MAG: MFS transporter, partial [Bacteroidales bacterium]|nr:MFS transporter [Bacteroidales bacterium]
MKNIKFRLILMNFFQFAVWGAYLTCMGNYLGRVGMGDLIPWFYAIQGIVSVFMPALMGIVADKFVQPQRLLGFCHLVAGLFMGLCWFMGMQSAQPNPTLFITLYTISVAFYMPTIALSNTVAFRILTDAGMDTVKDFPPIRVFGTVGFIATMWFVNCAYMADGRFGFMLGGENTFQY